MTPTGRNPGRIIGDVLSTSWSKPRSSCPDRRRADLAGRDTTEYPACAQHEALINVALAGTLRRSFSPDVTWLPRRHRRREAYASRVWMARARGKPRLYDGGDAPTSISRSPGAVSGRRYRSTDNLNETRGPPRPGRSRPAAVERVADSVLVVDELVRNTIIHAGGYGRLAAWTEDRRLVFEVSE